MRRWTVILLGVALVGCVSSNLPRGARLVGGGLMIHYEAPADGTVILTERTSGRVLATRSLSEGQSFEFGPGQDGFEEVLFRMFGGTNTVETAAVMQVPTNTFFQLYFVPAKAKKE